MNSFLSPAEPTDPATRRRLSYWLLLGLVLNALALGYYLYYGREGLRYPWQLDVHRNLVHSLALLQVGFPLLYLLFRKPRLALRVWLLALGLTLLVGVVFRLL